MLEVEILSSKNGNWVSMDDGPNLLGRTNLWPEALEGHGWLFLEIISADKATMLSLAPFTQKKKFSCSHKNTRVHMVPNLWSL